MEVYRITNKVNGKQYIGQTTMTSKERFNGHCSLKSGTTSAVKSAIQKYGRENFSFIVLSECKSKEELDAAEIFWIDYYQTSAPIGYNLAKGGNGGGKHSAESKLKMSRSRKGIQQPNKGCWPSVPVTCIQTGLTYESINKAAFAMKLQRANIQKVIYGERKHTGGFTFKKASND